MDSRGWRIAEFPGNWGQPASIEINARWVCVAETGELEKAHSSMCS